MTSEVAVRINKVEYTSGEAVAATHARSVPLTFVDAVTRQHAAAFHDRQSDCMKLKQESLQFINSTVIGYPDTKPLGRAGCEETDWEEEERFNAFGKGQGSSCYNCNEKCDFSRECPAKGVGKGRGKGVGKESNNKGFVKGHSVQPAEPPRAPGCWASGGPIEPSLGRSRGFQF